MHPIVNIALRATRTGGRVITRLVDRVPSSFEASRSVEKFFEHTKTQVFTIIKREIEKSYPDHCCISVDDNKDIGSREYLWMVNPLDGEINFLKGIPYCCSSVSVQHRGKLVHGVVVDHLQNEIFISSRGCGAQLDNRRIRVSKEKWIDNSVFSFFVSNRRGTQSATKHSPACATLTNQVSALRQTGSPVLDLAYVAAGRYDGAVAIGVDQRHIDAGIILVRESGGFVGDMYGGDEITRTQSVLACNPSLFKTSATNLRRSMKK